MHKKAARWAAFVFMSSTAAALRHAAPRGLLGPLFRAFFLHGLGRFLLDCFLGVLGFTHD